MNEVLRAIAPVTRIRQDGGRPQKEDLSMQSFLIAALGLAILTVIFALQNPIPVGVTFLVWTFEGSLALVLMLTFALGVLVSLLVSIPAIVKRRSAISNQKKKIEELENRLRERIPPSR
jgi:putative membrane protein